MVTVTKVFFCMDQFMKCALRRVPSSPQGAPDGLKMSAVVNGNLPDSYPETRRSVRVTVTHIHDTASETVCNHVCVRLTLKHSPRGGEMYSTLNCPLHKSSLLGDALYNAVWQFHPVRKKKGGGGTLWKSSCAFTLFFILFNFFSPQVHPGRHAGD